VFLFHGKQVVIPVFAGIDKSLNEVVTPGRVVDGNENSLREKVGNP
jgi:hypothetical protein